MLELKYANNLDYTNPSLLLMEEYQIAIEINRDTKRLHAADFYGGEVDYTTIGTLKEVSPALGSEIESYYKITLKEYGVVYKDVIFDIAGV